MMTHCVTLVVLSPGTSDLTPTVLDEVHMVLLPWKEREYQTADGQWHLTGWWDWYEILGRYIKFFPRPIYSPQELLRWDDKLCYRILAGEVLEHREVWDNEIGNFVVTPDFDLKVKRILECVHPESRVVIVDTHS